jgi:hypothetical protein
MTRAAHRPRAALTRMISGRMNVAGMFHDEMQSGERFFSLEKAADRQ